MIFFVSFTIETKLTFVTKISNYIFCSCITMCRLYKCRLTMVLNIFIAFTQIMGSLSHLTVKSFTVMWCILSRQTFGRNISKFHSSHHQTVVEAKRMRESCRFTATVPQRYIMLFFWICIQLKMVVYSWMW